MRTLYISISELEYIKFGLQKDDLTFTEFVELVKVKMDEQSSIPVLPAGNQ